MHIIWLDLANGYETVSRQLFTFALDFFYFPGSIKDLATGYFEDFQICCAHPDFTTNWQQQEVGIAIAILFGTAPQQVQGMMLPVHTVPKGNMASQVPSSTASKLESLANLYVKKWHGLPWGLSDVGLFGRAKLQWSLPSRRRRVGVQTTSRASAERDSCHRSTTKRRTWFKWVKHLWLGIPSW